MFSWGFKRKLIFFIFLGFFISFGLAIAWIAFFYEKPSCTDGRKNQDELGVDCGGRCAKVCQAEIPPVKIDWVRFYKVKDGIFSVSVRAENPNSNLVAFSVPYRVKFYDGEILLESREGSTYIPPGQAFGIFDGGVFLDKAIPTRVIFEWTKSPVWSKYQGGPKTVFLKEIVKRFENENQPRIEVEVQNNSLLPVRNIIGFAVVYDQRGTAFASSRTVIDSLQAGGTENMVFSWPEPFPTTAGRVEVLHWVVPPNVQN